jgi:CheY-like chemotaxis protein
MPGMSGLQFALRFRELLGCGGVPLVAITGHERPRLQAREVGIDHYLLKPADLRFLRELLGRLTASTARSRSGAEPRRPREDYRAEPCATA